MSLIGGLIGFSLIFSVVGGAPKDPFLSVVTVILFSAVCGPAVLLHFVIFTAFSQEASAHSFLSCLFRSHLCYETQLLPISTSEIPC